jgi:hypothetical protein
MLEVVPAVAVRAASSTADHSRSCCWSAMQDKLPVFTLK